MEVIGISNITINDYLREKDVYVVGNHFKSDFIEDVYMQVEIMAHVHRLLMSYPSVYECSILSIVGKRLEEYKVISKKVKRYINQLKNEKQENEIEKFLVKNGYVIIERSEQCISNINNEDYYTMIKRSMVRNELTLGKVDGSNLRVIDVIEIGDLRKLAYNLVEDDLVEYILKMKKRGYEFDNNRVINKFINASRLDYTSEEYLKNIIRFPFDTLKSIEKYRLRKKGLENSEYFQNIKKDFEREFGGL